MTQRWNIELVKALPVTTWILERRLQNRIGWHSMAIVLMIPPAADMWYHHLYSSQNVYTSSTMAAVYDYVGMAERVCYRWTEFNADSSIIEQVARSNAPFPYDRTSQPFIVVQHTYFGRLPLLGILTPNPRTSKES